MMEGKRVSVSRFVVRVSIGGGVGAQTIGVPDDGGVIVADWVQ